MDASAVKMIKGKSPLKASQKLREALQQRGHTPGSITFFYSAKNDRDIVVPSDIQFTHVLDLESDETVRAYDIDPARVYGHIQGQGYKGSKPDAHVTKHSGRTCLVEVKYRVEINTPRAVIQADIQKQAAAAIGADWTWYTDDDVTRHARVINDWLHIAPVLYQMRWDLASVWEPLTTDIIEQVRDEPATLGALESRHREQWALAFSAIWRLVQRGVLASDLALQPLSPATTLTWVQGHGIQ